MTSKPTDRRDPPEAYDWTLITRSGDVKRAHVDRFADHAAGAQFLSVSAFDATATITLPPAARAHFLARSRSEAGHPERRYLFAVCLGWRHDDGAGRYTWLVHDGRRLDTIDPDPIEMNV